MTLLLELELLELDELEELDELDELDELLLDEELELELLEELELLDEFARSEELELLDELAPGAVLDELEPVRAPLPVEELELPVAWLRPAPAANTPPGPTGLSTQPMSVLPAVASSAVPLNSSRNSRRPVALSSAF